MLPKVDYKSELKALYKPSAKRIDAVDVPTMHYLMVDGAGEPESESYIAAIQALFTVSYTMKFMVKRELQRMDYGVMPLEGLWWAEDMSDFITRRKDRWLWTMMILQPDCVDADLFEEALKRVRAKKKLPALDALRYQPFTEGLVAQTLHIGPFDEEGPTVERLHQFIADSGHTLRGKHHEIYLSDIRRAAPKNWKTIIRQPMG
ncbi:GyrI-like domain-containing protein [Coraliomargarita algicola]|uniref:GyrI-like domain-containing protein n=1 Tax=Coraliomargarita algicola TaxID=3092156 RepID=A0ABZ0RNB1_9BACT|nr:GyrI-like domain-containing protein [Coraliomargarita sp. J2-16]WPJ96901.1 GyrI-like domain-containing protein [Coraliomargarita sp. J2-16]